MSRWQQIGWAIIIVVILAGAYWWWASSQGQVPVQNTQSNTPAAAASSSSAAQTGTTSAPVSATVTFDGSSFSPADVTIAQGGTVTWNSTAGQMWVASDPHPLHNGYDGTTRQVHCAPGYTGAAPFDECSAGTSFSFTFDKVGTWGYHDHLDAEVGGTVTVVAAQ